MEIIRDSWYKPMQIAKSGWITTPGTTKVLSIYSYILKEIDEYFLSDGERGLRAINYARGKAGKNYFKVKGEWILEYLRKFE